VAALDFLEAKLERLEAAGLLRSRSAMASSGVIDFCSNDYLGNADRPVSRETSGSPGAGAARLIHGTRPQHVELEHELAAWMGTEDALLFPSGYAANLGVVSALAEPDDLVVSDALNHASTIDGCRLSRARVEVVPHRDLDAMERALAFPVKGRRWVCTETYFSMDATSPDVRALRALCDRARAGLILDEAHALGVFGPDGAGIAAAARVRADVLVGTLGKAVGVHGAFVAGSRVLTAWLWNRARSFVFSTAPSPLLSEITLEHVRVVRKDDNGRRRLRELSAAFERDLGRLRSQLPEGRHGPVFPLILGAPDQARALSAALLNRGFLTQPIRPPTVATGTSRLRLTLKATHDEKVVAELARCLLELCPAS
jgi:8-amino-7-oxononanoate synthase